MLHKFCRFDISNFLTQMCYIYFVPFLITLKHQICCVFAAMITLCKFAKYASILYLFMYPFICLCQYADLHIPVSCSRTAYKTVMTRVANSSLFEVDRNCCL